MAEHGKQFWILTKYFKMEKKELVAFLDEIFNPFGFKRNGNNWTFEGDALAIGMEIF